MQQLIYIVLLQCMALHLVTSSDSKNRNKEIEQLQLQKSKLIQEIHAAIDDSVQSLNKSNDTNALLTISYIQDLKRQVRTLNETNVDDKKNLTSELEKLGSIRRQGGFVVIPPKNKDDKYFDVNRVYGNKKDNPKKWQERYENRILMQKKMADWLAEREAAKEKVRQFKIRDAAGLGKQEKCPRFGVKAPKRRHTRRQNRKRSKRISYKGVYPCCRKCCKKSDMGCLKK